LSAEGQAGLFELFERASALPAAERRSFLEGLERRDPAAARELGELLSEDQREGPLPGAPSGRRSLVDALVAELAREGEAGADAVLHAVLQKLAARTPASLRYSLQGEVARGGMGAILAVWDEDLGRSLAMKVAVGEARAGTVEKDAHVDARALARLLEEAQVTGQLDHPGIVPVHELGMDHQGRVYFTMRLVRGRDLGEILALVRRGQEGWTQLRALGVLLKVCEAMSYAHSNGVVHRDLKPANVMVGRFGEVYVMDWGLARARGRPSAREGLEELERAAAGGEGGPQRLPATRAGAVMGTPGYMSPEQAAGRLAEVDERSDVYALGAVLYELLAGRAPHYGPGEHPEPFALMARVLGGPPAPLSALAPAAPAELVAISEKAMSRDPGARYPDMGALGEDLRAFLEGRVVRAYRTGPWAEASKWVQRNRGFAAAIAAAVLLLVAGLTASLIFKSRSDHNALLAAEREELAKGSEQRALEKADEVLRLSALQDLEELTARADDLWPASPANVDRYLDWLRRAEALAARLPGYEASLAELRARARRLNAEERAHRRASDPHYAELEATRGHLEFLRRQQAALEAPEPLADPAPEAVGVDFASLPADARRLNELAWPLVDPARLGWGREAEGLVLARRAVLLSSDRAERAVIRDTLAWALFAAGRLDEALAEEEQALAEAPEEKKAEFAGYLAKLRAEIDERIAPEEREKTFASISALERAMARMEAEVEGWTFDSSQDRWWNGQLVKLVEGIEAFSDSTTGLLSDGVSPEHGWGVKKRLAFARTVAERTISGAEPSARWAAALASIRDPAECPRYGGLAIAPQLELLPVGRDPDSGLWEFAHLGTGEPAERGADGKLVLTEATGLVLVLLPGGTAWMGVQAQERDGPNYDPEIAGAGRESPVNLLHAVTLSPFFLSKYEMTQGQWLRFSGRNPSRDRPETYLRGWNRAGLAGDLLHPVETVSWNDCVTVVERLGLSLPSEAQWEYGARGGTATSWWTGSEKESLQGAANLFDRYAKTHGLEGWPGGEEWLDDGNTGHARVGSYRANAFGLHDVTGNVWEWCRDAYDAAFYARGPRRDPVADPAGAKFRMIRGGSYRDGVLSGRAGFRSYDAPERNSNTLGLRPARPVTP
jgi:formylglycine-generating enzyme required for sulfatase activity/serine/threonine protein kinase